MDRPDSLSSLIIFSSSCSSDSSASSFSRFLAFDSSHSPCSQPERRPVDDALSRVDRNMVFDRTLWRNLIHQGGQDYELDHWIARVYDRQPDFCAAM
ncbi:hypothetical protein MTR_2g090180 [Medicago truncatula]|uniref:Uncharacterized protein n=1 Tax=Medicago truncatula TaxID=3880 RepID=A0A072VBV2_MEDTR|nr:hypothetical protein MTR_2g090180 [Medicago truncatula]